MVELKTLKDMTIGCRTCGLSIELKEEAIKWVKHYQAELKETIRCCGNYEEAAGVDDKIDSWIEFFNITEEDLQ